MNKLDGNSCGAEIAKKIAKKMLNAEKYKEMMFDD